MNSANMFHPLHRDRKPGISLIEIGMVLVIISLALAPIVQMVSGPSSKSGEGSATRMSSIRSKEAVLANTIVERVIASGGVVRNCAGGPAALPAAGVTVTMAACQDNTYNKPMWWQWTVQNVTNAGPTPTDNFYYHATLNVYDQPPANGVTPTVTFPTYFFRNTGGGAQETSKTGIVIVQDVSGSMSWGRVNGTPPDYANPLVSSPYLTYRYAVGGYNPPAGIQLDINDNSQLDIVRALDADDPNTPWDDRYPKPGVLGMANCNVSAAYNSANFNGSNLFHMTNNTPMRDHARNVCAATAANWSTVMDNDMSRLEAARSSLLSFLVDIENDPTLANNMKMGFVTFSSVGSIITQVNMESPVAGRFPQMRQRLTWMNRSANGLPGGNPIYPTGGTAMHGGITRGGQILYADNELDNRIIFFVGDGEPTEGPTSHASFQTLAKQLSQREGLIFPGAQPGEKTTIFTLGLIRDEAVMRPYLKDDLADNTDGGAFFYAQNVADMDTVFEQVKYQLLKVALLNMQNRYNI